jgi:GntR family carbon starvation induced transcriptional regulator
MKNLPTQSEQAYQKIRQTIISGDLKPGDIINIDEICLRFGTSKTPTREALVVLTHEQFLESLTRVGYMVTKPSIRDVKEMFHIRIVLEVDAIGLASEYMKDEDFEALERNNKEEQQIPINQASRIIQPEAFRLNQEFHMMIAKTSGNTILASLIQQQLEMVERALSLDPFIIDSSQHENILMALKKRDKAMSQEAMKNHLQNTLSRIMINY